MGRGVRSTTTDVLDWRDFYVLDFETLLSREKELSGRLLKNFVILCSLVEGTQPVGQSPHVVSDFEIDPSVKLDYVLNLFSLSRLKQSVEYRIPMELVDSVFGDVRKVEGPKPPFSPDSVHLPNRSLVLSPSSEDGIPCIRQVFKCSYSEAESFWSKFSHRVNSRTKFVIAGILDSVGEEFLSLFSRTSEVLLCSIWQHARNPDEQPAYFKINDDPMWPSSLLLVDLLTSRDIEYREAQHHIKAAKSGKPTGTIYRSRRVLGLQKVTTLDAGIPSGRKQGPHMRSGSWHTRKLCPYCNTHNIRTVTDKCVSCSREVKNWRKQWYKWSRETSVKGGKEYRYNKVNVIEYTREDAGRANGVRCSYPQRELAEMLGIESSLNTRVGRYSADMIYENVVVEYDGWYWHQNGERPGGPRDQFLNSQGYNVLHVQSNSMVPSEDEVFEALCEAASQPVTVLTLPDWGEK